ncbi:MAG: hypothetical protein WD341_09385 [Tistlia sp.]|uniref:hypothetical protein n=1 Tax=Tistlia sp. TaxID=3057121 RepID=UPI0034A371EB
MASFSMTMEVDAQGVVVASCEGVFDAAQWVRQRREGFESRYPLEAYDGRPVVTDLRHCRLPAGDWAQQFKAVADDMKHRRRKPFRRALIVGGELGIELAVALFAEYQMIFHHPEVETRAFRDYDQGYAWAHAVLADETAPAETTKAETTKAPEPRGLRSDPPSR